MVLAGQVRPGEGALRFQAHSVDWDALARTHRPITLVVRAPVGFQDWLTGGRLETTVAEVERFAEGLLIAGADRAVNVAGLQIDYDSPTSKLGLYAEFLKRLHTPTLAVGRAS